jgi:hypothetical protein
MKSVDNEEEISQCLSPVLIMSPMVILHLPKHHPVLKQSVDSICISSDSQVPQVQIWSLFRF